MASLTSKTPVRSSIVAALLLAAGLPGAAGDDLRTATVKIDAIVSGRSARGAPGWIEPGTCHAGRRLNCPPGCGVRPCESNPPGVATGAAIIDIGKVLRAHGLQPVWPLSKLIEGEHPISVRVRIRSAGGSATVDVERAEDRHRDRRQNVDLLIQCVLLPLYPNAAVGRPFEMGHNIERIDVRPASLGVVISTAP